LIDILAVCNCWWSFQCGRYPQHYFVRTFRNIQKL